MKNSLLSATSLASVTYTPSLALQARNPLPRTVRPLGIPVSTVGVLAASLAGLLTTYGAPATAAVIYSVDKSSLSFGNLLVGASSASQTVVITNQVNGTTTVAITAGTGVTTNISSTVLKKLTDTDPFNASVKAATRGALSSSITLSGTNPGITAGNPGSAGNPDVTPIPVTATGVAPMASVTATAVYVLVGSGSKASTTATVTNIGDGNLSGLGASSNLSAGTNTGVLGTGWAGSAANTVTLADSKSSSIAVFTYTAQATRSTGTTTITSAFSNGNPTGTNTAVTITTTLTGASVAPVASISSTITAITARAGTTGVGTNSMTIKNIGDASATLGVNLSGTVSSSSPGLTGGGAVNLADGANQTYSFTYAPTVRQSITATITAALTNGSSDGKNNATNATASIALTAVGPVYSGSVNAVPAGVGNGANAGTVFGGTILFGDFVGGLTTQKLLISNLSNDSATKDLTDLNLTSIAISNASEFSFSLTGFNSKTASSGSISNTVNGGIAGDIAIQFIGLATEFRSALLTIRTDEGASENGAGTIYVYDLRWTVPEPGTLMVFGVGMLGLAISRRNRRGNAEAVSLTAKGADETKI